MCASEENGGGRGRKPSPNAFIPQILLSTFGDWKSRNFNIHFLNM
jgi:hypothetical protein